jgi:hypothetical protein
MAKQSKSQRTTVERVMHEWSMANWKAVVVARCAVAVRRSPLP